MLQLERETGSRAALLQIVTMPQVPTPIRQAAALRFKRLTENGWDIKTFDEDRDPRYMIGEPEREVIRRNLVPAILQQSLNIIRNPLLDALLKVMSLDFPERLPEMFGLLMSEIAQAVPQNDNDPSPLFPAGFNYASGAPLPPSLQRLRVYNALCAIRMIFKHYESEHDCPKLSPNN